MTVRFSDLKTVSQRSGHSLTNRRLLWHSLPTRPSKTDPIMTVSPPEICDSRPERPGWHTSVLWASCLHSGIWSVLILALPQQSASIYGFSPPPQDLYLWQGTGLFIGLLAGGYFLAARDPDQHWGIVALALGAKFFGAIGMAFSVVKGDVNPEVLWLLPINDVIWWWPFWKIISHSTPAHQR